MAKKITDNIDENEEQPIGEQEDNTEAAASKKGKKVLSVEDGIRKEFGENILVTGNYLMDKQKAVIPISPALDMICDGIREGSYITVTGPAKAGKTTTMLHFAATAQQPKYGSRDVYYLNIENRLKPRDLKSIPLLNMDKFHIIQSEQGHILHGSEFLDIAERLINTKPKSVIIIDSYSALCCEDEMVGSMADMQRASAAKLLSKFCRKTCGAVPVNDIILAGITHIQSNVSGYGAQYTEKSGNSLLYQVDLKLWAKSVKPWRLSDQGAQIGQLVEWTCTVSGSDIPPGSKTTSYIRYGCGIDMITELLVICCDLGIVKKSASWLKFEDGTQAQGMENARTIVLNTPGLYENLYSKVKEIIKLS